MYLDGVYIVWNDHFQYRSNSSGRTAPMHGCIQSSTSQSSTSQSRASLGIKYLAIKCLAITRIRNRESHQQLETRRTDSPGFSRTDSPRQIPQDRFSKTDSPGFSRILQDRFSKTDSPRQILQILQDRFSRILQDRFPRILTAAREA